MPHVVLIVPHLRVRAGAELAVRRRKLKEIPSQNSTEGNSRRPAGAVERLPGELVCEASRVVLGDGVIAAPNDVMRCVRCVRCLHN
jgi:hypothetical protein